MEKLDTTERSREIVSKLLSHSFHYEYEFNPWSIDPEEYIQAAKDFGLDELAKEMEECLK